jgi:hypothetical protein
MQIKLQRTKEAYHQQTIRQRHQHEKKKIPQKERDRNQPQGKL